MESTKVLIFYEQQHRTIFSLVIRAPDKFRAVGPTCKAANPPIKNNSQPRHRKCRSRTGKPLTNHFSQILHTDERV
ncbi:hypothetical protein NUACC26_045000 [Scytonema sp. NUACC26]